MKKFNFKLLVPLLAFVLSITLTTQCVGQDYYTSFTPIEKPQSWKVLSVFIGSIVLDAAGDALNDEGMKGWGHTLNAGSVGLLLASPFILDIEFKQLGWYVASYLFLRVAIFDPVYNSTRGLPLNYIGTTSTWDKALQKINPPGNSLMFGRAVFFTVGICIPIQQIK